MEINAYDTVLSMKRTDSRARITRRLGVVRGTRVWQIRCRKNAKRGFPHARVRGISSP